MSARYLLGVDGGNTKTVAAVIRDDGKVMALARGGATDIHVCPTPEVALAELARVVKAALDQAGVEAPDLTESAFSLAGADWPEDFALLEREISARLDLVRKPVVVNDAMGALRSGSQSWEGVSIACGTFNAVGARNREGRIFHVGFWPDHAGGFDLGLLGLKAVYRACLGLGPATALVDGALAHFGAADWRALMHQFTRLDNPRQIREVQQLAPLVLGQASAGDAVAQAIAEHAADVLSGQARVAAEGVGLGDGAVAVLTGGVLQNDGGVLRAGIERRLPQLRTVLVTHPPVLGAIALAFDRMGAAPPETALAEALAAFEGRLGL